MVLHYSYHYECEYIEKNIGLIQFMYIALTNFLKSPENDSLMFIITAACTAIT